MVHRGMARLLLPDLILHSQSVSVSSASRQLQIFGSSPLLSSVGSRCGSDEIGLFLLGAGSLDKLTQTEFLIVLVAVELDLMDLKWMYIHNYTQRDDIWLCLNMGNEKRTVGKFIINMGISHGVYNGDIQYQI